MEIQANDARQEKRGENANIVRGNLIVMVRGIPMVMVPLKKI